MGGLINLVEWRMEEFDDELVGECSFWESMKALELQGSVQQWKEVKWEENGEIWVCDATVRRPTLVTIPKPDLLSGGRQSAGGQLSANH